MSSMKESVRTLIANRARASVQPRSAAVVTACMLLLL